MRALRLNKGKSWELVFSRNYQTSQIMIMLWRWDFCGTLNPFCPPQGQLKVLVFITSVSLRLLVSGYHEAGERKYFYCFYGEVDFRRLILFYSWDII